MLIGELAEKSGFSRDTIRYYEKLGLLEITTNDRQENNYKNYSPRDLKRLVQIGFFKELGFTLSEVSGLFKAFSREGDPCADLPDLLDEKITLLDVKISQLQDYKNKLQTLRKACDGDCGGALDVPECFREIEG